MAYDDMPRKPIEVREGEQKSRAGHDAIIDRAADSSKYGSRTDAGSDGVGYLGMDDLDRMRRKRLSQQTK